MTYETPSIDDNLLVSSVEETAIIFEAFALFAASIPSIASSNTAQFLISTFIFLAAFKKNVRLGLSFKTSVSINNFIYIKPFPQI